MRPTEILMEEHRVIEVVLACLDRMADDAHAPANVPVADARDAIEFLRPQLTAQSGDGIDGRWRSARRPGYACDDGS